MQKILITAIFLVSTSVSAFQMIQKETKIPSHVNGHITTNQYTTGKITSLKKSSSKLDISAKTHDVTGKIYHMSTTSSDHSYCLENYNDYPIYAAYKFELAIGNEYALTENAKFMLDANEFFCTNTAIEIYVYPNQIGSSVIKATTEGQGDNERREVVDKAMLTITR